MRFHCSVFYCGRYIGKTKIKFKLCMQHFITFITKNKDRTVTGLEWPRASQEVTVKVKQPVTGLEWPRGFQEVTVKVKQPVTGL
jgi:hypothetical protein